MAERLYDVLIYELTTRTVVTLVGERLAGGPSVSHAETHQEPAPSRLKQQYAAVIVATGRYQQGDIVAEEDLA